MPVARSRMKGLAMARRTDTPPERLEHWDIPGKTGPRPEPQDAIRPAQGILCAAALSTPLWVLILWALRKLFF